MDQKESVTIGDVNNEACRRMRIVHISDTHMRHEEMLVNGVIPDGDILIHSGDFGSYNWRRRFRGEQDMIREIEQIDAFFKSCPHKYKIFVAGNHETNFASFSPDVINSYLSEGIYLQDSHVTLEGITIYGSPWNNDRWYSNANAFAASDSNMKHIWSAIPNDVDILVTHNPPYAILDLATMSHWKNLWRGEEHCSACGGMKHEDARFVRKHWGCPHLRNVVLNRVKPKAHLYGHVHGENGLKEIDGIIFSNAAMKLHQSANVIEYCVPSHTKATNCDPLYNRREASRNCIIM